MITCSSEGRGEWNTDLERHQVAVTIQSGEYLVVKHFLPHQLHPAEVVSSTGAGDSLVGSLLADLSSRGEDTFASLSQLEHSMERAQKAAIAALMSSKAVSPRLSSSYI